MLELGGNNAVIVDGARTSIWRCPPCCSARWAPPDSAAHTTRRVFLHARHAEQNDGSARQRVPRRSPSATRSTSWHADGTAGERPRRGAGYAARVAAIRAAGGEDALRRRALAGRKCFVEPALIKRRKPDYAHPPRRNLRPYSLLWNSTISMRPFSWHNDVPQGLSSAMFTDRLLTPSASSATPAAIAASPTLISVPAARRSAAHFGGEKDTGGGRESGSDSWKAYMRRQTNTLNWSRNLPLAQGIEFKISS
jgi:aldehyde dehydrogenase (NAD+)